MYFDNIADVTESTIIAILRIIVAKGFVHMRDICWFQSMDMGYFQNSTKT